MKKQEPFIDRAVGWGCRMLHLELSSDQQKALVQFVKFGLIGVSNTVISYALNAATLLLMRPFSIAWDYIAGNVVSFLLSVLWSFYWNNKYVFTAGEEERRSTVRALLKTYVSYGFTGIVLNNLLSVLWIRVLGVPKLIAPLCNIVISVPLNFLINKFWAFRTEKQ
ncbi:MAG: GtrA family protein [Oscillospiraceae bacterium]|nr:GtrA family protein [Oscillospiraceae bacterium]